MTNTSRILWLFLGMAFGPLVQAAPDLSSPEAVMKLVPELRGPDGKFTIPDPNSHLDSFLRVHRALTNLIEMVLVQAAAEGNPAKVSANQPGALQFPAKWRSAEVGVQTDGKKVSFPDAGKFASYGGVSFLTGVEPLPGSGGTFQQVVKADGSIPAIVYAEPTLVPTVNRLVLAAANSGGFWQAPSYALGNAEGMAWLIVDKCVDLAAATDHKTLAPNAELFIAIHWADTPEMAHMRTDSVGHVH